MGFSLRSVPEKPNVLVTNRRFAVSDEVHIRRRYLDLVQAYFQDTSPFLISEIEFKEEKGLKMLPEGRPRVMVAFGSKWKNKQLPEEILVPFLKQIEQKEAPVFYFPCGSEVEKQQAIRMQAQFPGSHILEDMSLPYWQAMMKQMDYLITVDSAALHLCATTATPCFSIFGPSKAAVYKPEKENHHAVQGSCPYGKTFSMRCPILRSCSTGACMASLKPDELSEKKCRSIVLVSGKSSSSASVSTSENHRISGSESVPPEGLPKHTKTT